MIQTIALDDEMPGLAVIENFSSQTDFIQLNKTFTQPSEALKYLKEFPVDLLFLDIQMPTVTGLDFYKQVEQNTMVIFTTAYSQYAVEGFNLQAVDYLLKPFTFERFLQAANRAKDFYEYNHQQTKPTDVFLFVRADYSLIKINVKDIVLVEGLDDYLRIHIEGQKPVITRMTMKSALEKLPGSDFQRVHRSYIVPLKRIKNVRNKIISLPTHEVPIGASYEEQFLKRFMEEGGVSN